MLRFSFFQRGRIELNNLVSLMQHISLYGSVWQRGKKKRSLCSNRDAVQEVREDIRLTMHWSMVQRSLSFHWQKAAVCQEQYTFILPLVKSLSAAAWSSLQHCRPACRTPPFAASWQAVSYHHQPNHRYLRCLLPKSSHSLTNELSTFTELFLSAVQSSHVHLQKDLPGTPIWFSTQRM